MTPTAQQVAAMHHALHQFGYTDLRNEDVRGAAENVAAGNKPQGIIEMFVQKWMRDAGLIA